MQPHSRLDFSNDAAAAPYDPGEFAARSPNPWLQVVKCTEYGKPSFSPTRLNGRAKLPQCGCT